MSTRFLLWSGWRPQGSSAITAVAEIRSTADGRSGLLDMRQMAGRVDGVEFGMGHGLAQGDVIGEGHGLGGQAVLLVPQGDDRVELGSAPAGYFRRWRIRAGGK